MINPFTAGRNVMKEFGEGSSCHAIHSALACQVQSLLWHCMHPAAHYGHRASTTPHSDKGRPPQGLLPLHRPEDGPHLVHLRLGAGDGRHVEAVGAQHPRGRPHGRRDVGRELEAVLAGDRVEAGVLNSMMLVSAQGLPANGHRAFLFKVFAPAPAAGAAVGNVPTLARFWSRHVQ